MLQSADKSSLLRGDHSEPRLAHTEGCSRVMVQGFFCRSIWPGNVSTGGGKVAPAFYASACVVCRHAAGRALDAAGKMTTALTFPAESEDFTGTSRWCADVYTYARRGGAIQRLLVPQEQRRCEYLAPVGCRPPSEPPKPLCHCPVNARIASCGAWAGRNTLAAARRVYEQKLLSSVHVRVRTRV
ncbi:hypothetical protein CSUI_011207 [Cystoisospora suis]|uniref:Uncharacterized protein n=1 Tax=Cystoisospora suis TaxID=483139 RepID=A0A2C6KEK4_9APIC|nr:hypothetical protein CSUI_011207 [Cystoisospora suis]